MEQELLTMGSKALKQAALSHEAKDFILSAPTLYRTIKKAADRYIGGETLGETIQKVRLENKNGFKCSMEYMGENTLTEQEAEEATLEFLDIVYHIHEQQLNSTVSLDLSHIGLAVSHDLCLKNIARIAENAKKHHIEVTISAEGVEITDAVIDIYKSTARMFNNTSITLQAYLHRTRDDFRELIQEDGRIRMVKGAFETPEHLSLPRGKELDERYLDFVDQLLSRHHKCSIATHHDKMQQEAVKLIQHHKANPNDYEFESLYGIQTERLIGLKEQGYPTKLYLVYGKEWYLYLCNRIAEYPLYLFRALNDILN